MSRRMLRFDYLNGIFGKHRRRVLRKQQLAHREAQRAEQSLATLVEPLEDRILLTVVIDVEDVTTIHDETAGLQNDPSILDSTDDNNGNDIALAEVAANTPLNTNGAIGAALSGYDGSTSQDAFTIDPADFTIDNLALTDANGDPLDGDDSGLDTVAGNDILLFSDANDNIVFGVEELPDNTLGDIVFAIYLDEADDLLSGQLWTVQYEAISHTNSNGGIEGDGSGGSHDEPLDLTNTLFVTASRDLEFKLDDAPSGQNLFIMFGDGEIGIGDPAVADPDEVGIVATGKNPLDQSANPGTTITAGDTVNTSQGGGDTTFGINNQMIDEGEGIYFTFVTGPEPEYTVPNLDQNEADIEANIQFDDVLDAKAAEFQVVQLQSGKTAELKVTAYAVDPVATGDGFIDENGLTGNTSINITSFELVDFDGDGKLTAVISNVDGVDVLLVSGVEAGDTIRYFTNGDAGALHNRVLIEHDGSGRGKNSADFDIGGFKLIQAEVAFADVGLTVYWEDDGPRVTVTADGTEPDAVYLFDGNATDAGNFEGNNGTGLPTGDNPADQDPNSVDVEFAPAFTMTTSLGADGGSDVSTFSLVLDVAAGSAVNFSGNPATSGGDAVVWQEVTAGSEYAGVVDPGGAGEAEIFSLSVDGDGTVTFSQSGVLDHTRTDSGSPFTTDILTLDDGQISIEKSTTATDGDSDTATDSDTVDLGGNFAIGDDGPTVEVTADGTEPGTVYLFDGNTTLAGNFEGNNGTGLPTGDDPADQDPTSVVVDFAPVFSMNSSFGADGGSDASSFSLVLGVPVGDQVVFNDGTNDVLATSGGIAVDWAEVAPGSVYAGVLTGTATEVFRLSVVDSTSGDVTFSQSGVLDHTRIDSGSPFTTDILTLVDGQISIQKSTTATDGDLDTATDSDAVDLGGNFAVGDDGPTLEFSNLVGTVTTTPQIGFWDGPAGADQPGTLSVSADGTFEMVTADGVSSLGTVTFIPGTGEGTLTADFDNDPTSGDPEGNETIAFSLIVNDDGTYVFTLDQVILPVVVLDTSEGQLPAGGPDPVQTLTFGEGEDLISIVFFAVDAQTAVTSPSPISTSIPLTIPPAAGSPNSPIGLGEPDLTEDELQALSAMVNIDGTGVNGTNDFAFIRDEIEMNVSTSGIGVNNNVLQGEDLDTDTPGTINSFESGALDESFVINPEPLASEIKVYISKTAGGFAPPGSGATPAKTDYLYWNLYDELGNSTGPELVLSDDVFDEADVAAGGTGENLWSFTVNLDDLSIPDDFGDSIDAIQFTMGFGAIKIPKIEIVVSGDAPPNDIFLDFTSTLTDADGDTASSDFEIDLVGFDVISDTQLFDYTLVDADPVPGGDGEDNDDAFNVDVVQDPTSYLVQGFVPGSDQLYILNGSVSELNTGSDLGVGDPGIADSEITVDGVTVIVEDATLSDGDITDGLNFLAEEEPAEDDGLVMLLV